VLKSLVSIDHILEDRVYLCHWIQHPDGYDGSVRGHANFTNFRDFFPGEPEVLKSLVSIDQVIVDLVYLCHWIQDPDGYAGSVRGLAKFTKFADFAQENHHSD
jgi:diadenosine tetraphosphatase ApaH/serine/threonine PP2A family protein phosphatase